MYLSSEVNFYCTLDKIDVVKHAEMADTIECTDCGSFKRS
nr:DUF1540 domain-containing protein [uncultured Aminipila sp.]